MRSGKPCPAVCIAHLFALRLNERPPSRDILFSPAKYLDLSCGILLYLFWYARRRSTDWQVPLQKRHANMPVHVRSRPVRAFVWNRLTVALNFPNDRRPGKWRTRGLPSPSRCMTLVSPCPETLSATPLATGFSASLPADTAAAFFCINCHTARGLFSENRQPGQSRAANMSPRTPHLH